MIPDQSFQTLRISHQSSFSVGDRLLDDLPFLILREPGGIIRFYFYFHEFRDMPAILVVGQNKRIPIDVYERAVGKQPRFDERLKPVAYADDQSLTLV